MELFLSANYACNYSINYIGDSVYLMTHALEMPTLSYLSNIGFFTFFCITFHNIRNLILIFCGSKKKQRGVIDSS